MDTSAVASLLAGALDLHVHAAPSLWPRWGDAVDLARAYRRAGMRAFLLKAHHGSSTEAAHIASRAQQEVEVHGGIVLNHGVGGLNPVAVENAILLGAKMIWLPTIHARAHEELFKNTPNIGDQAIDIRSERGIASPLQAILELARDADVAVATGHISNEEIFALSDFVMAQGWSVRLVVNHVGFPVPGLQLGALEELSQRGVWLEVCAFTTTALGGSRPVSEIARFLRSLPAASWIIASDGGQKENPSPPEMLLKYVGELLQEGVSKEAIRRSLVDHPRTLLGL